MVRANRGPIALLHKVRQATMVEILPPIVFLTVLIVACVVMLRKAGYSGWWALLGLVPLVNIIMFLVFAFRRWPIQSEIVRLRAITGSAGPDDFDLLLSEAVSKEQRGELIHAVHLFELLASKCSDEEIKSYASNSIERIKQELGSQQIPENPYASPREST